MMRKTLSLLSAVVFAFGISGCATNSSIEEEQHSLAHTPEMSDEEARLFNAAMKELNKENYKEGIALLKQLTLNTRKSAIPFINLAIAQKQLDDFAGAEENLKTALEIEPDNPVASNEFGLLLRRVGRFEESRAIYEKILTKYPNFALANKNLGVLCDIYIRDYSCALDAYKAYSVSTPDDENVQIWITDLEWRLKQ